MTKLKGVLLLSFCAAPLAAQGRALDNWTVGLQVDARAPTGAFRTRPSPRLPGETADRVDKLDTGVGGRLFATGGLSENLVFRVLLDCGSFSGTSPGQGGTPDLHLSVLNFALGGGLAYFLQQGGSRPHGFYLVADLDLDRDSFTSDQPSSSLPDALVPTGNRETSRLGADAGFGWIARGGFTVEFNYHTSLGGAKDIAGTWNDPTSHFYTLPNLTFLRIAAGFTWRGR